MRRTAQPYRCRVVDHDAPAQLKVETIRPTWATMLSTITGISKQDIARIFEPFFRGLRPRGDGTGLGLSIVRRIVERCGGTIELASGTAGLGLTVRVTLPLAKKSPHDFDVR